MSQHSARMSCSMAVTSRGYAVWRRILGAVADLTRTTLAEGERVN